jgi:hypothetical protein
MATNMNSLETDPKSYRRLVQMFARRFAMTAIANLQSRWAFVTKPLTLDLPAGILNIPGIPNIQCAFVVAPTGLTRLVTGERRQSPAQDGSAPTVNSKRNKSWLPEL